MFFTYVFYLGVNSSTETKRSTKNAEEDSERIGVDWDFCLRS